MSGKAGINSGDLSRRVSILGNTNAKDVTGVPKNTFTTFAEVSAKVDFRTASELETTGNKETGITNVVFTVGYRTDFTTKQKLSYKNKVFNILSILPIHKPRKLFMQLVTEQIEITTGTIADGTAFEDLDSNVWITQDGDVIMWN